MARDDQNRYRLILESTRDADGLVHRDEAVKMLAELLADESDRMAELAESHANSVAKAFDKAHQPEIDSGQMTLFEDSYLVLGDSERVRARDAKAIHTRRWLEVQAANHARVAAAWSAKDMQGRKLLEIQDRYGCSLFVAQQIASGEVPAPDEEPLP